MRERIARGGEQSRTLGEIAARGCSLTAQVESEDSTRADSERYSAVKDRRIRSRRFRPPACSGLAAHEGHFPLFSLRLVSLRLAT